MDTIYNKLIELRKKQEALAFDYEEKMSYEMAYLSWWYVLEKILKIMDAEYRKKHLYRQVCEWKNTWKITTLKNQMISNHSI